MDLPSPKTMNRGVWLLTTPQSKGQSLNFAETKEDAHDTINHSKSCNFLELIKVDSLNFTETEMRSQLMNIIENKLKEIRKIISLVTLPNNPIDKILGACDRYLALREACNQENVMKQIKEGIHLLEVQIDAIKELVKSIEKQGEAR
jgi:hypothetical protein